MPKRPNVSLATPTEDRLSAYRERTRRGAPNSLSKNSWAGYAAATGVAVAGGHAAEAAIVQVTPPNPVRLQIATSNSSTVQFESIDIDDNGVEDLQLFLARITGTDSSFVSGTPPVTYNTVYDTAGALGFNAFGGGGQWAVNGSSSIRSLAPGDLISSGQLSFFDEGGFRVIGQSTVTTSGGFSGTYPGGYGQFPTDGTALAGLRFERNSATHYGWIRLRFESGPGGLIESLEALEWAYQDVADAPIEAGAVIPEPTGLALLAAGAAGVVALRRRSA